jgi:hypothetical protein
LYTGIAAFLNVLYPLVASSGTLLLTGAAAQTLYAATLKALPGDYTILGLPAFFVSEVEDILFIITSTFTFGFLSGESVATPARVTAEQFVTPIRVSAPSFTTAYLTDEQFVVEPQ